MKLNAIQLILPREPRAFQIFYLVYPQNKTHVVEKAIHYFLQYIGIRLENIAITFLLQEAVKPPLKSSR